MSIKGIGTIGYPMAGYETKQIETNVSENQFMDTLWCFDRRYKENFGNSIHRAYAFISCYMKKDIEVLGSISKNLNVLHCIFIALFFFFIVVYRV